VADLNLTDMETCYKAFRTSLLKSIPIRSERFGIEPELTIKTARRQVRIYETPISYHGRIRTMAINTDVRNDIKSSSMGYSSSGGPMLRSTCRSAFSVRSPGSDR
jgi:hypothetical protein